MSEAQKPTPPPLTGPRPAVTPAPAEGRAATGSRPAVRPPTQSRPVVTTRRKLGEMLVSAGIINREKLQQALSMAQRTGERLGQVLVKAGFARPEQIAAALAQQFGIAFVAPREVNLALIDREALQQVELKLLQDHHLLPVVLRGVPHLLISDPLNTRSTDRVEAALGRRPYLITTQSAVDMVMQVLAFETLDSERIIESARESIDQGELQSLFEYLLGRAVLEGASDIHLEPTGVTTSVRFRVDGELRIALSLPRERHNNLTNLIFGRAGVDLSDFQRLHDGRFSFEFAHRRLDIRFACSPTVEGPMMVLRILDDSRSLATLEELGYLQANLVEIRSLLRHPFGLILVVGPTGSGKTTTLYSCLSRLNDGTTKILTVEDPVEIRIPSIQQVQVNDKAGVSFGKTVRSFLRQDPDVILVGEIRDEETAKEAFRAANTGHMVLSTLHANSAVEAIGRLSDLGMDPFQISTTLLGSMSQRLIRKLCPSCRKTRKMSARSLDPKVVSNLVGEPLTEQFVVADPGPGCEKCADGYLGRRVVAEVMQLDDELRQLVHKRSSNHDLVATARRSGFRSMLDNALLLVRSGEVSLADAEAAVGPLTRAPGK